MSENETLETRSQPLVPMLTSYCFNAFDLLQHEMDRLNALEDGALTQADLHQRKALNKIGIDKRLQYADISFGVLENGYFLHAISSAAYIADYNREDGEFHARKHLDTAMWEMNAFAVKDRAARDSGWIRGDEPPTHYPLVDTWKQTEPRAIVTQGLGNKVNSPRTVIFNVGHLLGWIYGVENINDRYKDVTMAVGVLPNGFVVVGAYQAYDHNSYAQSVGIMAAYADLEQQCLKYRLFTSKQAQHDANHLDSFEEVPVIK